jgi:hypothetical protein
MYVIHGKSYPELFGSRRQVWHVTAYKTAGNLTKSELFFNKSTQRIVSLKKHMTAKKEKRLEKAGYFTRKGKFGAIHKMRKSKKTKRRKIRGGTIGDEATDDNVPVDATNEKAVEATDDNVPVEATNEKAVEATDENAVEATNENAVEATNENAVDEAETSMGGKKRRKRKHH